MAWPEYEYAVTAYRTRLARNWEPIRELQTMLYNMFAEKADQRKPHELIPLFTDRIADTKATGAPTETPEAFLRRMAANNFFAKDKKDAPTT